MSPDTDKVIRRDLPRQGRQARLATVRLQEMICVTWRTVHLMLDKIRRAKANRDRNYVLGVNVKQKCHTSGNFRGWTSGC